MSTRKQVERVLVGLIKFKKTIRHKVTDMEMFYRIHERRTRAPPEGSDRNHRSFVAVPERDDETAATHKRPLTSR